MGRNDFCIMNLSEHCAKNAQNNVMGTADLKKKMSKI
jgi:hypothetical protein